MSLVLAALLAIAPVAAVSAAAPAAVPSCSWNRPGQNPFMGDVVAAVDRYSDIPAPVRERLKARMAARSYDEVVSIRRDAIVGKARYGAAITGMHFGAGQVCGTVNRAQWAADAQERGLVYCESGHCVLVPTVCRNVSRITRQDVAAADAAAPSGVPGMAGGMGGGGGGGSSGASGSGPGAPGTGEALAVPGAESGAPASAAGGPSPTSFSQAAAAPGVSSAYGAGGSSGPGAVTSAAGGADLAHPGSWATAAGGASLGGVALGVDGAAPPPRQISALPPENRGLLTDAGPPASPAPGSVVGLLTGPLIGPVRGLPDTSGLAVSPVPEPASALLLLVGLGWLARRAVQTGARR